MQEAFVFDAIRTPRGKGKRDGSLYEVKPVSLLAGLLRELEGRNQLDTSAVDDVVMGCVSPVGDQGSCIAKTAAVKAGWNVAVSGIQVNRYCASGLEAVNLAAQKIRSGWESLVVAGGVESMSRIPMGSDGGAWFADPETNFESNFVLQGISADLLATLDGVSREEVDLFACESQRLASQAQASGCFTRSVIPVKDQNGLTILSADEFIKPLTTPEVLAGLKPSFAELGALGFDTVAIKQYPQVDHIDHIHTPGNSSGIVDGAAAVLLGSAEAGRRLGISPRGRIVSAAVIGTDPTLMLAGPAPAARKALALARMNAAQIDLFEVNEAFAAVVLRFMREMDVPREKVNVNGGAIAFGHPLGATGAMILGTLLDELERRQLRYGLATLCVGSGMGIATIVERL